MADFGIGETIAFLTTVATDVGTVASAAAAGAAGAVGLGGAAGAIGTGVEGLVTGGIEGSLAGAALGAGEAALTGQDLGRGALSGLESGAITGGAIGGLGPAVSGATGLSPQISDALVGAGAGAAGSAATGTNPLTGALTGGVGGYVAGGGLRGGLSGGGSPTSAPAPAGVTAPAGGAPTGDISLDSGAGVGSATSAALPGDFNAGAASGSPSVAGLNPPNPQGNITPNLPGASPLATPQVSLPSPTGVTPSATGAAPGGGIMGALNKNPALALAGGGLLLDVVKGNQNPPGYAQLKSSANQNVRQGEMLQSYINSGTLPPGLQGEINAAGDSAQAAERSSMAAHGMPYSSAEAQDVAGINERIAAETANIATSLYQQGTSQIQLGDQIYEQLMQTSIQQDQALSQGISSFAAALAGMSRPVQPQVTG